MIGPPVQRKFVMCLTTMLLNHQPIECVFGKFEAGASALIEQRSVDGLEWPEIDVDTTAWLFADTFNRVYGCRRYIENLSGVQIDIPGLSDFGLSL